MKENYNTEKFAGDEIKLAGASLVMAAMLFFGPPLPKQAFGGSDVAEKVTTGFRSTRRATITASTTPMPKVAAMPIYVTTVENNP